MPGIGPDASERTADVAGTDHADFHFVRCSPCAPSQREQRERGGPDRLQHLTAGTDGEGAVLVWFHARTLPRTNRLGRCTILRVSLVLRVDGHEVSRSVSAVLLGFALSSAGAEPIRFRLAIREVIESRLQEYGGT